MDPTFARTSEEAKEKLPAVEYKRQQDARWYKLVEDYSRCGLTVATDKLIAFAGIAQSFTSIFLDDQYVAGMWRSQMPLSLCWGVVQHSHKYRPRAYIAPSWSWASVKGVIQIPLIYDRVCYDDNDMKVPLNIHCKVKDVRIGLTDARYATGQVSSGQLDLQACLLGPIDWKNSSPDSLKIIMPHTGDSDYRIGFQEGGEVNFDESSRDGAVRMAWLDGSSIEEDEVVMESPPSFLIPIADFSAESCDPPHPAAVFGIVVCQIQVNDSVKYYRVGNFEHVVLPHGIWEAFPPQDLTID